MHEKKGSNYTLYHGKTLVELMLLQRSVPRISEATKMPMPIFTLLHTISQ